jgi:TonB-linked SusC/RagA family outer membrane protein
MRKIVIIALAFLFLISSSLYAQERTITGKVTSSEDGSSLPGVNVMVAGTKTASITDMDGNYSIKVPSNDAVLSFSFLGFQTQVVTVGDQTKIDIVLQTTDVALDQVVVTALGISREKKTLGYAISEVSGEDVSTVKDLNVVNSLAGKISGVVVTQGTFGPGSSSRIIIRGNNSLSGNNQPLIVVDGVPIDNGGSGSASSANAGEYNKTDYGSGVSDINPDDIESVTVLKGPNAAALYGSRASNGVILFTTKSGKAQKGLGVTYSSNFTWENPMLLPKFQNEYGQGTGGNVAPDLGTLRTIGGSWGAKLDGSSQLYYTGTNKPYSAQPDNVKDFFETGKTMVNTVSFDGGTDKANFRFSYSNTDAGSILPNSTLKRNNFNLRSSAKLTDFMDVDAKVTYFVQDSKNRPTMGTEGVMAYLYPIPRNLVLSDLENYQDPANFAVLSYRSGSGNPYWYMMHDENDETRDRVQGYAKLTIKFTDYLSLFGRIGTDVVNQKIEMTKQYGHWFYARGRLNNSQSRSSETNMDALLMFNKNLTEKFGLSANLGANHMYSTYESQGIFAENFKIPTSPTLQSAEKNSPSYQPRQEKVINSVYGSLSLSYGGFLYLESSMRNDWSSTLPKGNWSYFYPSVSLSAIISELVKVNGFDYGKLRINWAKVGSDTDPYQLENSYILNSASDSYLGLTILTRSNTRKNPNLKPEQTSSLELGGEFRFLKNRLYADISYYNIISSDLIMRVPIPASTGYSFEYTNVGEMQNKGFEVMLGIVPLKTPNLTWDISMNFAKNKNTLNELIEGVKDYEFTTTNSGAVVVMAKVGGGYGDIFATVHERDANGKIVVNADGTFKAATERKFVGNYQPDWTAGLTNTLTYKSLSLKFQIDARFGGKVYSGTDAGLDGTGVSENSLEYRTDGITIDGVYANGTPNTTKITAQQYWGSYSSIGENYIFDQTNIRLRMLSLTYDLPKSVYEKIRLKGASIGLVGRNLFFLYKKLENYDPEGSFSTSNFAQGVLFYNMPTTRSFGFNLNIKF